MARRGPHTPMISRAPDTRDPDEEARPSRPSSSFIQLAKFTFQSGSGRAGRLRDSRSSWGQFCSLDESSEGAAVPP